VLIIVLVAISAVVSFIYIILLRWLLGKNYLKNKNSSTLTGLFKPV
jgi:hypothetical protein